MSLHVFVAQLADTGALSLHAQECRQVKAWRKEHALGLILNFPTKLLQPPEESYANRETDEAHVQELIESFEEKDSTNRKGIRVVAINKDLWQTWSTATGEQREELLVHGSAFMKALFECYLGVPTGDHTREAIQRLSASHPNKKKYKVFAKGLKVMLCEGNAEDIKMLTLLGNIDNAKRQLQLKLDFPAKLLQIHTAWMAFDKQILHGDKKQAAAAKLAKSTQLKSYQGQWKMKYDMVYAFSQIGALMGRQWGLAWKIVNGLYPSAPKSKAGVPIKLQTNSQLNLIPGMEEEEANMLMQRVIDGELDRGDLRKECLKRNAYEDMRKNAIDIINSKTRSERDIKEKKFTVSTWEVEEKFPVIANKKFMDGWLTAFLHKKKKAPAPVAFSAAITELLDNMTKKTVLTFKLVLLARPLFMKRPSHFLTHSLSLVETPGFQRELLR